MHNIIIKISYSIILIIVFFSTLSKQAYAVTYEEIQENPLSLSLNLKYAKEQEDLGNVKNAMVTIERLLLLYPNDIDLNVYYLDLLLDLNSISKASEVVNQLLMNENSGQALLDELGLIAKELDLQKKGPSPFSLALRTTLNITAVDNVNSISKSKTRFTDSTLSSWKNSEAADQEFKYNDELYLGKISALASYDLNEQNFFTTEIGFDKLKQEEDINKIYDLKSATVSHVFYKPRYSLSSYLSFTKTDNPPDENIDTIGRAGGFSGTYNINERLSANVGGSVNFTDYIVDDNLHPAANLSDARNRKVSIGSNFLLTDTDIINVNFSYNYKNAKAFYNSLKGNSYQLSYTKLLPFDQNLSINYGKTLNDYMDPDDAIHSEKKRKDIIEDYSIGISGPVPFTNFSYSLSSDYSKSNSRILNYIVSQENINFTLRREFSLF